MARRLERAGAGAIVLPSLFEEEILAEEIGLSGSLEQGAGVFAEALDYFPAVQSFAGAADRYVTSLQRVKASVTIPVIASLNGSTLGGWVGLARRLEDAGADALELNLYHIAADPRRSASAMESRDLDLIAAVRAATSIPLAVKLSPFYSAFANFAEAAAGLGVEGLVLFNRFYQPDLDLESIEVVPRLELSQPWEMRLPVRWIAILRPQLDPDVSLAATSGAHSGADVAKGLLVGADVVMMTSALLRHGPEHVASVETELRDWMAEHDYTSVTELRGSASAARVDDPSAFERANYMATLHSWASTHSLTAEVQPGCPSRATAYSSRVVRTEPKWPGVPGATSATTCSPSAPRCSVVRRPERFSRRMMAADVRPPGVRAAMGRAVPADERPGHEITEAGPERHPTSLAARMSWTGHRFNSPARRRNFGTALAWSSPAITNNAVGR